MRYDPRPHDTHALEFLRRNDYSGLLALRVGLGKTAIAASALAELLDTLRVRRALLVGTPRVVRTVWPLELAKWDHLRWIRYRPLVGVPELAGRRTIDGTETELYLPSWLREVRNSPEPLHLATYDQLATRSVTVRRRGRPPLVRQYAGLASLLKRDWPYELVIFDEVHRMKAPGAKRFRSFRQVLPQCQHVIGLTGSPSSNSLLDLWGPVFLVDKGRSLGRTVEEYKRRWFFQAGRFRAWEPRPGALEEITRAVSGVMATMRTEDYQALPPLITNEVAVELPPGAAAQYERLRAALVLELDEGATVVAANAAVLSSKLEQAANGAIYPEDGDWAEVHDAKLDALDDILAAGEPVLCGIQFRSDAERIQRRFPQARRLDMSGETVADWNAGRIPLLIAHGAQAEGLNLQEGPGRTVVWFSPPWNLVHYEQLIGRLHRPGQGQPCIVHHLIASGTVDEAKLERLRTKAGLEATLMKALRLSPVDSLRVSSASRPAPGLSGAASSGCGNPLPPPGSG